MMPSRDEQNAFDVQHGLIRLKRVQLTCYRLTDLMAADERDELSNRSDITWGDADHTLVEAARIWDAHCLPNGINGADLIDLDR